MKRIVHTLPGHTRMGGFTLIELMVTITILAILLTIAVPNMSDFIRNGRLTAAANDLLRSYQLARTEAIKKQQSNVYVCASANPSIAGANCSGGSFATGWIVFGDTNGSGQREVGESIIEKHDTLDSSLTVKADSNGLTGFTTAGTLVTVPAPTQRITICDSRGTAAADTINSYARFVLTFPTGRSRASRTTADVANSVACP